MRPALLPLGLFIACAGVTSAQLCGDVTEDGVVNVLDALTTARGVVGLEVLSASQQLAADVDSSGDLNVLDALQIARFGAGIGTPLSCPPAPPPATGWREVPLGATRPSPRCEHSAGIDSLRNRTLLFGGNYVGPGGVTGVTTDLWAFDLTSETWTELHPAGTPAAASNVWNLHEDVARNRMIGHSVTGGAVFLLDFAGGPDGAWGTLATSGTAPGSPWQAGGYHVAEDALIVFDGVQLSALSFGGVSATWQQLTMTGDAIPFIPYVFQAEMLYDSVANRCLFTAHDPGAGDMAIYEILPDVAAATAIVRRLTPTGQCSSPSNQHHAAFDSLNNRIVFSSRGFYTNPTVLDLSAGGDGDWSAWTGATGPGARAHGALCADNQGRVIFQGGMALAVLFEDTWVFE